MDDEAPRGEVVFALAKAVACVVACAACLTLAVVMIFAKTFIAASTLKYGFVPVVSTVFVFLVAVSHQMGVDLKLFRRIYWGSLS
jgi:hypothetical protein